MVNLNNSKITNFLSKLSTDSIHKSNIELIKEIPPKNAEYTENNLDLPDNFKEYLLKKDIKLYTHQYSALENVRNRKNILLTTSTASGKTLSFNLPILETLQNDKDATALYIYPTKALTNDQLNNLKNLENELNITLKPEIYDGDTPNSKRKSIREKSRIILTNPHELHQVLQYNPKWISFFKNLKYIVIDEAHTYRGIFGSNISFLIRRLRRICGDYGSDPQFILASATLANAKEFSEKLVGLDFTVIDKDGSPKNKKYFVFYNTLKNEISESSWYSAAINILELCMKYGLQTIGFTLSRKMAELITIWTKKSLGNNILSRKISSYRSGFTPEERRDIESRLKNGDLRALTSTNALEVGIDIGSLDSVIMYGYPGTLMSLWQQAGRAGRAGYDSVVTLLSRESPLDQYIISHPETVFGKTTENAVIDLENPQIIVGQLLCAAAELPITLNDKPYFGENIEEYLNQLSNCGLLEKTDRGWVYVNTVRASELVSLDSIFSSEFKVVDEKGNLIEILDEMHAYPEAHVGAVLLHNSENYIIKEMDLESKVCTAVKKDVEYYTKARGSTNVEIINELDRKDFGSFSIHFGEVIVSKTYIMYDVMKFGKRMSQELLNLPPITFQTTALWYTFEDEFFNDFENLKEKDFGDGLHGTEHAMINIFPIHIMCDSHDIGGLSTNMHYGTRKPSIFIYDGFEGGIGLSKKAYEMPEKIAETALNLIKDCTCEEGCPACLYSPNCGNDNQNLDKQYTLAILEKIVGIFEK